MEVKFGKNFSGRPNTGLWVGMIGQEGRNIIRYIKCPLETDKNGWILKKKRVDLLNVGAPN